MFQLHPDLAVVVNKKVSEGGRAYSEILNEIWHLLGKKVPTYISTQVGSEFKMLLQVDTVGGIYKAEGKSFDKSEARRLAAGDALLQMNLITEVLPPIKAKPRGGSKKPGRHNCGQRHSQQPRWRSGSGNW